MRAFDKVYGGENSVGVETIGEILEVGKRVGIRSGDSVEAAVVATGPPAAVFFLGTM